MLFAPSLVLCAAYLSKQGTGLAEFVFVATLVSTMRDGDVNFLIQSHEDEAVCSLETHRYKRNTVTHGMTNFWPKTPVLFVIEVAVNVTCS